MKVELVMVMIAIAAICLFGLAMAGEAQCGWCPTIDCFSSTACGSNCTCVIPPGEYWGSCYSLR